MDRGRLGDYHLTDGRLSSTLAGAAPARRDLEAALGKRFLCGVVLYAGEDRVRFGGKSWAVPIVA
jgi:hypothetical protein